MDILVHLPIHEKVSPAERGSSFSSFDRAGVSAKPEVIVAFDAQLEEFIHCDFSQSPGPANTRLHFVVIALRLRKPMCKKRSKKRPKRTETVRKFTVCSHFGCGIQREAALGDAQQRTADAKPSCERSRCGKERPLRG